MAFVCMVIARGMCFADPTRPVLVSLHFDP